MTDLIEAIRKDREAGTPGPWDSERIGFVHKNGVLHPPCPNEDRMNGESWLDMRRRTEPERLARAAACEANARRRQRVPELEQLVLDQHEKLLAADALAEAIDLLAEWQAFEASTCSSRNPPGKLECTDEAKANLVSALDTFHEATVNTND